MLHLFENLCNLNWPFRIPTRGKKKKKKKNPKRMYSKRYYILFFTTRVAHFEIGYTIEKVI